MADPLDALEDELSEKSFTSYDVQMSLFDSDRVDLFRKAITEVVNPGDIVVDGGSGTGLLGMLAALAGAAKVYCIELSPEYAEIIEANARNNGLDDRITVICGDASTVELPERVDVVICEVVSAGFFFEPQLAIVDNLRGYLKDGGVIVPKAAENYIDLIAAQEKIYGLKFTFESRWKALDDDVKLTSTVPYLFTDFSAAPALPVIHADVNLRVVRAGLANALRVSYKIHFTESIVSSRPSTFLLNPQIIFLPDPVKLDVDQAYRVSLNYRAASNPRFCGIRIDPLNY